MKPAALSPLTPPASCSSRSRPGSPGPVRLVGLHFFNPVAQMPLIEVVHADGTDAGALETATGFARRIDKLPLACKSAPGFMVNRVLTPYMYEAMLAAEEGVPLAAIDRAATDFGMPMGPIELIDVVGLDVAAHVGEIIAAQLQRPVVQIERLTELLNAKRLGRKSGAGFYTWQDGKAVKPPAGGASARRTHRPADPGAGERMRRLPARGGGGRCRPGGRRGHLRGRIRPIPWRASHLRARAGIAQVVARLKELAARHGARFEPDAAGARCLTAEKRDRRPAAKKPCATIQKGLATLASGPIFL